MDSLPFDRIAERDAVAFAATQEACRRIGWRYAVWGTSDPVGAANLRWLPGYRHPRCYDRPVAGALRDAFVLPRTLMSGAEQVGDPAAVLPVLYHLMWRHELVADLSLLLGERTVLSDRRMAAAGGVEHG